MRPFNLEKAANGGPVMTKSGLPARVICVDANNPWEGVDEKICVIALVKEEGLGKVHRYNEKGEYRSICKDPTGRAVVTSNPDLDLVMATQKHEGWINVYPERECSRVVYVTEEDAKTIAATNVVDTVKIEWEE